MTVGSIIEAGCLLPTITQEKVVHKIDRLVYRNGEVSSVYASVYYFDILLGRFEGQSDPKGDIQWLPAK